MENKIKIITISMELAIDEDMARVADGIYSKDIICNYLNDKLYNDPEWFGNFGPENIVSIKEFE